MKKVYFTQINNVIAEATFLPLSVAYVWDILQGINNGTLINWEANEKNKLVRFV